jgi:hypothetical protein
VVRRESFNSEITQLTVLRRSPPGSVTWKPAVPVGSDDVFPEGAGVTPEFARDEQPNCWPAEAAAAANPRTTAIR